MINFWFPVILMFIIVLVYFFTVRGVIKEAERIKQLARDAIKIATSCQISVQEAQSRAEILQQKYIKMIKKYNNKLRISLTACVCINLILSTALLTHYLNHKTDLKLAASLREVQESQIAKLTEQNEFLTMQNQLLGTALDERWEPLPITCDEEE